MSRADTRPLCKRWIIDYRSLRLSPSRARNSRRLSRRSLHTMARQDNRQYKYPSPILFTRATRSCHLRNSAPGEGATGWGLGERLRHLRRTKEHGAHNHKHQVRQKLFSEGSPCPTHKTDWAGSDFTVGVTAWKDMDSRVQQPRDPCVFAICGSAGPCFYLSF